MHFIDGGDRANEVIEYYLSIRSSAHMQFSIVWRRVQILVGDEDAAVWLCTDRALYAIF